MYTYRVRLEALRNGHRFEVIIVAVSESEAKAQAKEDYRGYRALAASIMGRARE